MSITFIVADKFKNRGVSVVGDKYFTDCTVSISHSFNNNVTEHAVESGASMTDHVQVLNNTFTVSGIFSNAQLNKFAGDKIAQSTERIKSAYQFLTDLRNNATLFTLVSMYDVYPNCVVSSLNIPVSVESSTNLYFELNVTQIRQAKVESVKLSQVVTPQKKDDASSTSYDGKTQPKIVTSVPVDLVDYVTESTERAKELEKQIAEEGGRF